MSSYISVDKKSISEQGTGSSTSSAAANCCSRASSELKLYQAFIFSVPIFFTFVLLLLFYLFYLRRRRVDWSSLRMRTGSNSLPTPDQTGDDISMCELGLKKELREMLPIVVFRESFSIKDTQCSVCLGDYEAEDRLQQIPACGHAFHMGCIDLWLATHTTCPLCRQSLLIVASSTKDGDGEGEAPPSHHDNSQPQSNAHSDDQTSHQNDRQDTNQQLQPSDSGDTVERVVPTVGGREYTEVEMCIK